MVDFEKRNEFGEWLRSMRKRKNLSLNDVARALCYATKGTIVNVETGFTALPVEKIDATAAVLGIDLNVMLDKLQECEPELYAKYVALERIFFTRFTSSISRAGIRADLARHHRPFRGSPEVDIKKVTRTIYYPNMLIQPLTDMGCDADAGIPPWIADEVLKERMHHEDRV